MRPDLPRLFAFRYFRGRGSLNAVPILSRISMTAIAVSAAAMVVLFSVFNGFEGVIKDLYKAFYPDMRIAPRAGKFFTLSPESLGRIRAVAGVQEVTTVIEDNAFVNSDQENLVVTLKGVEENFSKVNDLGAYLVQGTQQVEAGAAPTALVGLEIAAQLGLDARNDFSRLALYYPDPERQVLSVDPSSFQSLVLRPGGVFRIQDEFDGKYVLCSKPLAEALFHAPGQCSAVELKLRPGTAPERVQRELEKLLGAQFTVATRYEQNHTLFAVMSAEKWVIYAILFLVLLIASFNMIGALSLMVLEKGKDMGILRTMGAGRGTIRGIFLSEGLIWSLAGGGAGILLGLIICLVQIVWQPVKLQGTFIIEAYPVVLQATDFLLIVATIAVVGFLAALYPAYQAGRAGAVRLK